MILFIKITAPGRQKPRGRFNFIVFLMLLERVVKVRHGYIVISTKRARRAHGEISHCPSPAAPRHFDYAQYDSESSNGSEM